MIVLVPTLGQDTLTMQNWWQCVKRERCLCCVGCVNDRALC